MNNQDIIDKVKEIKKFIEDTTLYKNYLKSQELVRLDENLISLIDDIKKYQKEIIKHPNRKNVLEEKINKNLGILNDNPTYLEYINFQDELNNMIVIFENKINKYFESLFK